MLPCNFATVSLAEVLIRSSVRPNSLWYAVTGFHRAAWDSDEMNSPVSADHRVTGQGIGEGSTGLVEF